MSIAAVPDDFERVPPHDIAAEQCALGGMLLSKDAQADVAEVIRPSDHYRPAHQVIHEAILALQERVAGGNGGVGGVVDSGAGDENNGGARAGTGGSGGAGGLGGTVGTGNAASTAGTINMLNTTILRVRL